MRTTEQNLEKIFSDRLKTVAEAVKTNHFDAAYFANLPRENAYKIVSRYARVLYNGDIQDTAINSGIWQELLVNAVFKENPDFFEEIRPTNRNKDIFRNQRNLLGVDKPFFTDAQNNEDRLLLNEVWQCKHIYEEQKNFFYSITLYDYQVPIKSVRADAGCGKIDLVGASGDEMVIIEYKAPRSNEPLLRAITEIITYFYQIGGKDGAKIYLDHFNKTFGLNCKKVRMAVIAPRIVYRTAHRYAYALIKKYNILCYHFDEAPYLPLKLCNTSVERYRYMSENSMQFIYDHSNEIVQILKNS